MDTSGKLKAYARTDYHLATEVLARPCSHSLPYALIWHLWWALPPQEGLPLGLQPASQQTLRVKNTSVKNGSQVEKALR